MKRYLLLTLALCLSAAGGPVLPHRRAAFRDAGATGQLTCLDTDDQGDDCYRVWGDATFVYSACGADGLRSYSVDETGAITLVDTDDQGGSYRGVWGDGSFVYVAWQDSGLASYSVDGSGALTYVDADDQGGSYYGVWGDGDYLYAACGEDGLRSYSVDGSGTLTYVDADDQGGIYTSVWGDGSYIYASGHESGLHSYSVDGAGALTHVDTDDQGGQYWDVWGDGTYLYAGNSTLGIMSYSVDGAGALTYVSNSAPGGTNYGVWGDGTYIYAACNDYGIRSYSVDGSGQFTLLDADDQGANYYGVWGDGVLVYAACGNDGLRSYSVDGVLYDAYAVLQLHCDGVDGSTIFRDTSKAGADSPHAVTANGNAQVDTAQSKFGGAAALFDGTGDYLSIPNSTDVDLGTAGNGDFTVDWWARWTADSNCMVATHDASGGGALGWVLGYYPSNLYTYFGVGTATTIAWTPTLNTWYHLAFVRYGSTVTVYVDGVSKGTCTDGDASSDGVPTVIGQNGESAGYFNGHIDELRISKGIARWTENFTPPTAPYEP